MAFLPEIWDYQLSSTSLGEAYPRSLWSGKPDFGGKSSISEDNFFAFDLLHEDSGDAYSLAGLSYLIWGSSKIGSFSLSSIGSKELPEDIFLSLDSLLRALSGSPVEKGSSSVEQLWRQDGPQSSEQDMGSTLLLGEGARELG